MANYKMLGTKFDRTFRNDLNENFKAIDTVAEQAKVDAGKAVADSASALSKSNSTQTQLDQIVINGDSSVESAQARVASDGTVHTTLKARLDSENDSVTSQLAQLTQEIGNISSLPTSNKSNLVDALIELFKYKVIYSNEPPTTGAWNKMDRVYNTELFAGGYVGWICVESGEFGSSTLPIFKPFGLISE